MASLGLFQRLITIWGDKCFGQEVNRDKRIRRNVFMEEASELFQSLGGTEEEAMEIVRSIFERPVGEPYREFGGVMVTTALLAEAHGQSIETLAMAELRYCEDNVDKIRARRLSKSHARTEEEDADTNRERSSAGDDQDAQG